MQLIYSPFIPKLPAQPPHQVRTLGDSAEDTPALIRHGRTFALLKLQAVLKRYEEGTELGESPQDTSVDQARLNQLLDASGDADTTEAVNRLSYFLIKQRKKHRILKRQQLDAIRQFYIDQTADTLARYGYEDSPYGEHDVSVRRGDAVAARKHMDEEDERMHAEGRGGAPSSSNIKKVIKNLRETAYLSDFLDRLTQDAHQIEDVPVEQEKSSDAEMDQLTSLQTDEESITAGIEKLLASIKSGQPMNVEDALNSEAKQPVDKPEGDLEDRATAESKRLSELEKELQQQDAKNSAYLRAHKIPKAATVSVPLPKLQSELNGVISAELDHTLRRFKTMRLAGEMVDPVLKAKIEHYMGLITANLLQTCVSYEQWNQQHAIDDEAKALDQGDAGLLSRYHTGTNLASSKVVRQFVQTRLAKPMSSVSVPWKLQSMMKHGVNLPGVGHLVVTLHRP
jgi:hypothetical protein